MPLSPAHWERVRSLFEAAAGLDAAAREALIAPAGLPAEALAELRSLLRHHDAATGSGGFLRAHPAPPPPPEASRAGQRLGAWQIVRPLGSGGMGEVFEVRRADGSFEGRAAVKLLKRGMDSAAVLARFAQERQALARLNHPHIARLLDAGASDDGLPYFVMEYVDGRPIHEAAQPLPLEQRLQLFLQLADAVAHAHRNLLVHRDLKPGNVLVDAEGQVKLLDFGIAKALDPTEGDSTGTTQAGERPFTPHYASPEQVRGEPVSTATDIYSLGVLLYQLLTGTRPTGRRATTPLEAARSVLEEEPTRPSRLSEADVPDPHWLNTRRRLEGDLDNVLLKALAKQPERRYASVDAFAADLRAYLGGYPVSARAPSPVYVLGKFLRRNRWAVLAGGLGGLGLASGLAATLLQERVAAALGVLGLAAGLGLALLQARRAALARDQAAARLADTKGLLRTLVQQHADAIKHLPGGLPAREAMLADAIASLDRLARSAQGDDEIAATLGASYARLADMQAHGNAVSVGKPQLALENANKALQWFARVPEGTARDAEFHRWYSLMLAQLARRAQERGELAEAKAGFEHSVQLLRHALQRWPGHVLLRRMLAARLGMLAQLHQTVGWPSLNQPEAALALTEEAMALHRALLAEHADPQDRMHLALVAGGRAVVRQVQDRLDEARRELELAVQETARLVADSQGEETSFLHAHAMHLNNLSYVQSRQGDEAAALHSAAASFEACEALRRHEPANKGWRQRWAIFGQGYAESLVGAGRHAEALTILRRIEPTWQEDLAEASAGAQAQLVQRRLAMNRLGQARCLHAAGATTEALALATEAERAMAALVQAASGNRDFLLYHAETLSLLAGWDGPGPWRERGLHAYAAADALQPLQHDHLRAWQALQAAG